MKGFDEVIAVNREARYRAAERKVERARKALRAAERAVAAAERELREIAR